MQPNNANNSEIDIVIPPNSGIPTIVIITINKIYENKLVIVVIIKFDKYMLIL